MKWKRLFTGTVAVLGITGVCGAAEVKKADQVNPQVKRFTDLLMARRTVAPLVAVLENATGRATFTSASARRQASTPTPLDVAAASQTNTGISARLTSLATPTLLPIGGTIPPLSVAQNDRRAYQFAMGVLRNLLFSQESYLRLLFRGGLLDKLEFQYRKNLALLAFRYDRYVLQYELRFGHPPGTAFSL